MRVAFGVCWLASSGSAGAHACSGCGEVAGAAALWHAMTKSTRTMCGDGNISGS
jgi:hypothetical protein